MLSSLAIQVSITDERSGGSPLSISFKGVLRPDQKVAVDEMLKHDTGVLSATTAFGKTVVAAYMIAERSVNTLILVHRNSERSLKCIRDVRLVIAQSVMK